MQGHWNPVSKLTLAGLYGEQADGAPAAGDVFGKGKKSNLTIKVWIRGVKNMSILFLTSALNECYFLGMRTLMRDGLADSILPNGLLLTSKDRFVRYPLFTMPAS
jgi:hypothetical protein